MKAAEEILETLDQLIVEGNDSPEKIFNTGETSLFWKRISERTFIHKEATPVPGGRAFNDRISVSLGGSAAGYRLNFVIWHSEKPRAFKHFSEHTLPANYWNSQKSWVTQLLFQEALLNCYVSKMEKHYLGNKIFFKILLIVSNAPGTSSFYWCASSRYQTGFSLQTPPRRSSQWIKES